MRSIAPLFFVTLFAAGCGSGGSSYKPEPVKPVGTASIKPGEEAKLFPWAVGNQWTYACETTQQVQGQTVGGAFDLTFKITAVTPTADGERCEVEITNSTNPKAKDLQRWERNSKGIFQVAVGNPMIAYNPPQPVILFPAETGRKFTWKGSGMTPAAKQGTTTVESEILGPQQVDGATERYSAIAVSTKGTFSYGTSNGQVASTAYWQPGTGLVRYRQEVAIGNGVSLQVLRLKAKTVR